MIPARKTRTVRIGPLRVGGEAPIAVQSMAATRTQDIAATRGQVERLQAAGADLVRVAIDSPKDAEALREIAAGIHVPLSVDLQENYRMAEAVAPFVAKLRYNPGHLHHHERTKSTEEKVAWIVDVARRHDCAIRIGVNAGSIAPEYKERYPGDNVGAIVACAVEHCALLDGMDFPDFVVSIKDSDPRLVIDANTRFAEARPDVPIHLGVTEAGMPPEGMPPEGPTSRPTAETRRSTSGRPHQRRSVPLLHPERPSLWSRETPRRRRHRRLPNAERLRGPSLPAAL